jgi:hypothetical protein
MDAQQMRTSKSLKWLIIASDIVLMVLVKTIIVIPAGQWVYWNSSEMSIQSQGRRIQIVNPCSRSTR